MIYLFSIESDVGMNFIRIMAISKYIKNTMIYESSFEKRVYSL
jgi:hypothetical protein